MIHMNGSKYFIIYLNISIIPTFPLCFRAPYYVNKAERTDIITVIYYIFGLYLVQKVQINNSMVVKNCKYTNTNRILFKGFNFVLNSIYYTIINVYFT